MTITVLAVSGWLFYGGLNGADVLTHWQAQSRGAHEVNPVLRGPKGLDLAIKAGATVGLKKLEDKLPPKKRWILRVVAGGIVVYGIQSNVRARR